MALTESKVSAKVAAGVVPLPLRLILSVGFALGLGLVFFGRRVLVSSETLSAVASALGVALALSSTAVRFAPFRANSSQASVARLAGLVQGVGILGLAGYFLLLKAAPSSDAPSLQEPLQVLWIAAIAFSLATLAFVEGALGPMRRATTIEVQRVRAAASSGLVLSLAATYCSLLVYTAAKQEAQADFSYFKTASPGESTLKLVDQLSEPISVTGFFPDVSEVRKEVQSYLTRLSQRNPKLEVKLVDRYAEPKLAKELKVTADGTLILSRGETQQTLSLGVDLAKARPKLVALDKDFNSRLVKLLRSRRVAYLTTGHGEFTDNDKGEAGVVEGRTGTIIKQLIEQQNYRTKDLGLAQGLGSRVPDDADIVFILGPTQPFADEEIDTLSRFAEAGGKVFMALDVDEAVAAQGSGVQADTKPDAAKPDFRVKLGRAVGAEFVPVTLADEERFLVRRNAPSDHVLLPTNRFSSHASVSTLSRNSSRSGIVVSGSGYFQKQDAGAFQSEVAVRSYATTFTDANHDFKLNAGESKASYNLAMAITRAKATGTQDATGKDPKKDGKDDLLKADPKAQSEMRAFVFADADVFSDLLMGRVSGNQLLAFDAVRWLAGEESVAGEIESEEDVRIEPTKQKEVAWFYATIFGVPLFVLAGGLVISRKSRRGGGKES